MRMKTGPIRSASLAVDDFAFTVNIVAVVRVRAAEESVARRVVPTVLGAPGTVELRLANEGNAVLAHHATITNVDFSVEEGSIKLIETNGVPAGIGVELLQRPRRSGERQ